MNVSWCMFLFLLMLISSAANAQPDAIDEPEINPAVDLKHFESLISKSELVFLGDLRAISKIRRVADGTIPGPWVLTQYFMEIEKVVLGPPGEAVSETISFVSYSGDLTLRRETDIESGIEDQGVDQGSLASSGYKGVFERVGLSQSLSHSVSIGRTGRYLIFILSSRQRGLFDDARLLQAYRLNKINGKDVIEVGGKLEKVDYADLKSELLSRVDLLDSYDFYARRNRPGMLRIGG